MQAAYSADAPPRAASLCRRQPRRWPDRHETCACPHLGLAPTTRKIPKALDMIGGHGSNALGLPGFEGAGIRVCPGAGYLTSCTRQAPFSWNKVLIDEYRSSETN
jgi:hypothetical protein